MKGTDRLEIISIDRLIPYANNARTHSDEQLKKLQASLREFGFVNPVLIDKDLGIIAGHGRVEAARREGITEVPCVWVEHLTEDQKKAYILADNRLAEDAGWDMNLVNMELESLANIGFDTSLTGFDFDDLKKEQDLYEADEDDYVPDPPKDAKSKPGDLYILGRHRLLCGDATNLDHVNRLMDGEQADLIVTDPPYNVDYEGGTSDRLKIENDNMPDSKFREFLIASYRGIDSATKPGGVFYIWHADSEGYNFRAAAKEVGWTIRQCLIWNKNSLVMGRQDYHWKHEPCLYGWKDGAAHYFIDDRSQSTVIEDAKPDYKKLKKEDLVAILEDIYSDKQSTTVINEQRPSRNDLRPTMKPLKLLARLIKNSSRPEGKVLDPFGGSGSTLMACEQLNRTCYMMELDPRYVDVIVDRWQALTGQKAEIQKAR